MIHRIFFDGHWIFFNARLDYCPMIDWIFFDDSFVFGHCALSVDMERLSDGVK